MIILINPKSILDVLSYHFHVFMQRNRAMLCKSSRDLRLVMLAAPLKVAFSIADFFSVLNCTKTVVFLKIKKKKRYFDILGIILHLIDNTSGIFFQGNQ